MLDASVCSTKGLDQSGVINTGVLGRASFSWWKAVSHLGVNLTVFGLSFLVKSDKTLAVVEKLGMNF